jgi:hypothetical protein
MGRAYRPNVESVMSTRKLIVAALLTGMAILVAGTVLLLRVPKPSDVPPNLPVTTTTAAG